MMTYGPTVKVTEELRLDSFSTEDGEGGATMYTNEAVGIHHVINGGGIGSLCK